MITESAKLCGLRGCVGQNKICVGQNKNACNCKFYKNLYFLELLEMREENSKLEGTITSLKYSLFMR